MKAPPVLGSYLQAAVRQQQQLEDQHATEFILYDEETGAAINVATEDSGTTTLTTIEVPDDASLGPGPYECADCGKIFTDLGKLR